MSWFSNLSANRKINQKIKEVDEHDERLHKAERTLASLDLEMGELWAKVRHALGRIDKRAAIIERSQPEPGEAETAASGDAPSDFGLAGLSPAQLRLNEQILSRRSRM